MKRSLGLVLLAFIFSMSAGCASMQAWCNRTAEKEEIVAQAKPEVRPMPPPPPAQPMPPKKDRN